MRIACYLFILIYFISCGQTFKLDLRDRIFFRKIKTTSIEVEWYTYSAAWANFSDVVTVKKGNILDTVCISDNIADLYVVDSNKIVIGFYGFPARYMDPIKIRQKVLESPIIIDTTYIPPPPHARYGF